MQYTFSLGKTSKKRLSAVKTKKGIAIQAAPHLNRLNPASEKWR